jgi:hypothetical protein
MTPEAAKLLDSESAAWKSRDGRRAMKRLDLDLGDGRTLEFSLGGTYFLARAVGSGGAWAVPDACAVAFLKQQAREKLGHYGVARITLNTGEWVDFMGAEMPTESHALIAALLAGKETRC